MHISCIIHALCPFQDACAGATDDGKCSRHTSLLTQSTTSLSGILHCYSSSTVHKTRKTNRVIRSTGFVTFLLRNSIEDINEVAKIFKSNISNSMYLFTPHLISVRGRN